ncbi:hypothetical protein D6B99_09545 [Arachidicoccus soli]|uniref:Uncharacterized protein n=1 Tax=Arachidicoccus soli TaxID=2341117 RepID=A0A386HQ40_9BACT|nr:hypothetical protein D6B99_09545 [Arachidicoccus soli]
MIKARQQKNRFFIIYFLNILLGLFKSFLQNTNPVPNENIVLSAGFIIQFFKQKLRKQLYRINNNAQKTRFKIEPGFNI